MLISVEGSCECTEVVLYGVCSKGLGIPSHYPMQACCDSEESGGSERHAVRRGGQQSQLGSYHKQGFREACGILKIFFKSWQPLPANRFT